MRKQAWAKVQSHEWMKGSLMGTGGHRGLDGTKIMVRVSWGWQSTHRPRFSFLLSLSSPPPPPPFSQMKNLLKHWLCLQCPSLGLKINSLEHQQSRADKTLLAAVGGVSVIKHTKEVKILFISPSFFPHWWLSAPIGGHWRCWCPVLSDFFLAASGIYCFQATN